MHKLKRTHFIIAAFTLLILISIPVFIHPAKAEETDNYCLSCHGNADLSLTLPDGEHLSLYVSADALHASMHSQVGIECTACHTDITTYPHPKIEYNSRRELARALYLTCQKCHATNYSKTLDSIHNQIASQGNLETPICTDCHGVHNIQPPDQPRSLVSTTCGKCHTDIFAQYKDSIHGSALIQEDNPDVPVCTDCHGVHNIQDPRTALFRIQSPELCAGCHSNQELMEKYGLPANVYDLYELSWHGIDVSVYQARWPNNWHDSAVCTDCHGVHNIRKASDPQSTVNPANLLVTCQKCHPGVNQNWTAAWTGHNEIRLDRTPFLYYANVFYSSFTPYVLFGSALYVALQIIHALIERVKRSLR
jgi:predicted CXXCH cytochrome family protein